MNVAPVPIGFEDIPGDSKGYFHTEEKRIAVQENMSESQTLKTMVHGGAHSMLHNKEINRDDLMEAPAKARNTKEVEAESVAYTVCQHFGIDTSDYSFGYIAGWSSGKDMKELKSSLDTIRKTACLAKCAAFARGKDTYEITKNGTVDLWFSCERTI